jgi:glycosyltransferase involved in cell wall biosynthesis
MSPKVSVMMPAKNTGRYIGQAIQSIIDQTYQNWELIIVDDKSSDNTREIAESFAAIDKRIKIFDGDGVGVAHTRNQIIDLSQGKYIMLQDSDDLSEPNRVRLLLNEAEKHEKSYICSNLFFTDVNLTKVGEGIKHPDNKGIRKSLNSFFNKEGLYPQTALAHRAIYLENKYREFLKITSDWDLVLRIKEDPKIYFHNVQELLYHYRLNDGSMTLDRDKKLYYLLLVRYNEILRKKHKPEILSIEQFELLITKNLTAKVIYNFFFFLKKVQHNIKFRSWK